MEWEQPHWSGRPREEIEPRRKVKPNGFARLARFSAANRLVIIGLFVVVAVLCAGIAAATMSIDPEAEVRVTLDARTASAQAELDRHFPGIDQTFLAIVEHDDSDAGRTQALALAATLSERSDLFASAFVPGTGDFYETYALLFRNVDDVRTTVDQVLLRQPLYHALAAAPDITGLAALVSEIARAVEQGRSPPGLEGLLLAASTTFEAEMKGVSRPVDWLALAGLAPRPASPKWFVVVTPATGHEQAAALTAQRASEGMQGVNWLWPRRVIGTDANPVRDLIVPAGLAILVFLILLVAGLGSLRMALVVTAVSAVTACIAAATAALILRQLDGATWSFLAAAIAPALVSSILLSLAYLEARRKGLGPEQSVMFAAHRHGVTVTGFALVFAAFWVSWLLRKLPSMSHFAIIALVGAAFAWLTVMILWPALTAALDRRRKTPEPHWLDEALAEPASVHVRNGLDVVAMLVIAAAVFSAAFLPGVRFGERQMASTPTLRLDTPDARGAIHVLTTRTEADTVIAILSGLPETGAIRAVSQFLPPQADENIAELRRLEGAYQQSPAQ